MMTIRGSYYACLETGILNASWLNRNARLLSMYVAWYISIGVACEEEGRSLCEKTNASILSFTLTFHIRRSFQFLLMRPSKTGLMLLSTPSITSNIASTSASLYAAVVEEEAETNMPSSYCFDEKPNAPQSKDAIQRSPHQARGMSKPTPSVEFFSTFHFPPKAKLKKRHTFAQVTRHKLQKEQIQPSVVEQNQMVEPLRWCGAEKCTSCDAGRA